MPADNFIYKLNDISKSFRMTQGEVKVLKKLSLSIPRGKWVSLVGSSGCGKTTLLHLLGGLDRPNSGKLEFDGMDFAKLSNAKLTELRHKRIGFIFQAYHLLPELTSLENALLPAMHWGQDRGTAEKQARQWLENFGLAHRLHHRPRELSGGEQQRVAIARALINNPDVLLADEPTGNLDKNAADDIVNIIDNVCRSQNKTLIMVTHDMELADKADLKISLPNSVKNSR